MSDSTNDSLPSSLDSELCVLSTLEVPADCSVDLFVRLFLFFFKFNNFQLWAKYVIFPALFVTKRFRLVLCIQPKVLFARSVAADDVGAERMRTAIFDNRVVV